MIAQISCSGSGRRQCRRARPREEVVFGVRISFVPETSAANHRGEISQAKRKKKLGGSKIFQRQDPTGRSNYFCAVRLEVL